MLLKFLLSMLVYITSIISIFKILICENNSLKRYQLHYNGWRETSLHRYRYLFIVLRRKTWSNKSGHYRWRYFTVGGLKIRMRLFFLISDISDLSWNKDVVTIRCRAHHQTLTSHCISFLFTVQSMIWVIWNIINNYSPRVPT